MLSASLHTDRHDSLKLTILVAKTAKSPRAVHKVQFRRHAGKGTPERITQHRSGVYVVERECARQFSVPSKSYSRTQCTCMSRSKFFNGSPTKIQSGLWPTKTQIMTIQYVLPVFAAMTDSMSTMKERMTHSSSTVGDDGV